MGKNQPESELEELRKRVAELEAFREAHWETEKALRDATAQWNNLLELVGDSVFIVNSTKQRILEANSHAARRLGYTHDELLAASYEGIETEVLKGPGTAAWESSTSRTQFYDATFRRKDGSTFPAEVSSRIIRYKDEGVFLNIARDISLRMELGAGREQLIEELDSYAHMVAHDLKGPIQILIGYCDMLRVDYEAMSRQEIDESLDIVRASALRMQFIIEELLMLASIRHVDDIGIESLSMGRIIEDAMKRLILDIEQSGAVLTQPKDWPLAIGHSLWIEEVWVNYISNAVKYGGTPPHIELGATLDDGIVTFWVRDNGDGIPNDKLDQLFKPFTRLEEARAKGYGLGLSIVKIIVDRLGGDVGVSSTVGEGSTFSFTLPAP